MNIKNKIEYSVRANGDFVAMRVVSAFLAQEPEPPGTRHTRDIRNPSSPRGQGIKKGNRSSL